MVGGRWSDAGPASIREPVSADSTSAASSISPLHLAFAAMIGVGLAALIVDRRLPSVPMSSGRGAVIGVIAASASAFLAAGFNEDAFRFAAITAGGGCCSSRSSTWSAPSETRQALSAVLVATCSGSAAFGILLLALPPRIDGHLLGQDYTVAGARRLQASLGYPNDGGDGVRGGRVRRPRVVWHDSGRAGSRDARGRDRFARHGDVVHAQPGSVLGYAGGFAVLFWWHSFSGRRRLALSDRRRGSGTVRRGVRGPAGRAPVERLLTDSETGFYSATYDAPEHIERSTNTRPLCS